MNHAKLFLLYLPITMLMPALLVVYVGWHLVEPINAHRLRRITWWVLLFPAGLSASLALMFWAEQDRVALAGLLEPGFAVLGYLLTVAPLLLIVDFVRGLYVLISRRVRSRSHVTTTPQTKKRTWTIAYWTVAVIALGLCLWGRQIATDPPEIRQLRVPVTDLPTSFDGYTLLQLTDIHLRNARDVPRLEALVARTNALEPDLIAITGDVVDGPMDNLRARLQPLGKLRAKDGVWVVLGNHEYYADAEACIVEFERLGFTVLLDEHRNIHHADGSLTLAGVTNPQDGMHGSKWSNPKGRLAHATADATVALKNAPPHSIKLLLAHQPKSLVRLGELGVALAMAGHVHGGGFFPWSVVLTRFAPFRTGLWHEGKTWLYVSRGLGTFGPKLRLGARPEIAVFRLKRSH